MRTLNSVEEKILDRALFLIGQNGNLNVPIRSIAKEAEVNVSAINYYFRTKEDMIKQVKLFFVDNSLNTIEHLEDNSLTPYDKLLKYADEVMAYNLKYPGVTVLLKTAKLEPNESGNQRVLEITAMIFQKIDCLFSQVFGGDESINQVKKMIFYSAILHPIENGDFYAFDLSSLNTSEKRCAYIQKVMAYLDHSIDR